MTSRTNTFLGQVWVWNEPVDMRTRRRLCSIQDVVIEDDACEIYLLTCISEINLLRGVLLYSSFKETHWFGSTLTICHTNEFSSDNGWKPYDFES